MDLFDVLVRYETHLWHHLEWELHARSVGMPTLFALRVIARHGEQCRVQELRTDLGITVGAASKLVDRLERDGLALRSANPRDRRSSLISLSAAGRSAYDEGTAVLDALLAQHLGTEPGVAHATATLERLHRRLDTSTMRAPR